MKNIFLVSIDVLLVISTFSLDFCGRLYTCESCIQNPYCAWDLNEAHTHHCFNLTENRHHENVYNPPSKIKYTQFKNLSDRIHIQPQQAKLILRSGTPLSLDIAVKNINATVLEMRYTAPDFVTVHFETGCNDETEEKTARNQCESVMDDQAYTFTAHIEANCPSNGSLVDTQTIQISQSSSDQSLRIEMTLLCSCPCGQSEFTTTNSTWCNYHGTYKCGICECQPDYYGTHCECSRLAKDEDCASPVSKLICSNRGYCICGKCECHSRIQVNEFIYGRYCECDNFSCKHHRGKLCGGEERGKCDCGICQCSPGWGGEDCSCQQAVSNCLRTSDDDTLCSGNGRCECNRCKCEAGHEGAFCEVLQD